MNFISYKYWLNEKFVEDSDPIRDLGIGITYEKIKKWVYENVDPKTPWTYEDLLFICAGLSRFDFVQFLLENHEYNITELRKVYKDLKNNQINNNDNYDEAFKLIRKYIKKWHLGESLNEKFTEDSDPIHDMGIGIKPKIEKFILKVQKERGVQLDEYNEDLLAWAAYYNDFLIVKYLISKGPRLNKFDRYDRNPLTFAAAAGNIDMGIFLIKNGSNLKETINYAKTYCNIQTQKGLKAIQEKIKNKIDK
jgi:hypothetical protein